MIRPYFLLAATAAALCGVSAAHAVVLRHDVPAERYAVGAAEFPPLVDMPGVGHGVLIAPQWVVTAAHVVQGEIDCVTIAGETREVVQLIIHPGYRSTPQDMIDRALAVKDGSEIIAFLAGNHDIALVKLARPVVDVKPVAMYRGNGELGRTVKLLGKGATGTGLTGVTPDSPQRGELRRAFNRVSVTDGRWIAYSFDQGRGAHRLEGGSGSGDSGGPMLLRDHGRWVLAGLTSWQNGNPDLSLPPSRYGQQTYGVRISHYVDWIEGEQAKTAGDAPAGS